MLFIFFFRLFFIFQDDKEVNYFNVLELDSDIWESATLGTELMALRLQAIRILLYHDTWET
jgi:hypothetical protein